MDVTCVSADRAAALLLQCGSVDEAIQFHFNA
jgi:hypothetical protein